MTSKAGIVLNGRQVGVGYINKAVLNGFDTIVWFEIKSSNVHNQSNRITFEARTLKGLVGQINRHKFELAR